MREESLWLRKIWLRLGGGRGGVLIADLEGEAAREDARDEATMALASESTVTDEEDVRRRCVLTVLRLGGRDGWTSEADTNESSDDA